MPTLASNPVPDGMHTLTPHLICADAAGAIDFYRRAFGAEQLFRLDGQDGKLMHAMLRIGDSALMLGEEEPSWGALGPRLLKGTPVVLHLYSPDVDAAIEQAAAAGAKVTMPAADMFWGDRYGQVEDPYGHRWSIATHKQDLTQEEIEAAMRAAPPCGQPQ